MYPVFSIDGAEKDESSPGVTLLWGNEEEKETAEKRDNYFFVCGWEKYKHDGKPYWFNRIGYSIDFDMVRKLSAVLDAPQP